MEVLKSVTTAHSFSFIGLNTYLIFFVFIWIIFSSDSTVLLSLASSTDVNWKELKTLNDSEPALVRSKVNFWLFLPGTAYQWRKLIYIFLVILQIHRALTPMWVFALWFISPYGIFLVHFTVDTMCDSVVTQHQILWQSFASFGIWILTLQHLPRSSVTSDPAG